jgi:hypothetical protein
MSLNYNTKYLKYKNKYLKLKNNYNMKGGALTWNLEQHTLGQDLSEFVDISSINFEMVLNEINNKDMNYKYNIKSSDKRYRIRNHIKPTPNGDIPVGDFIRAEDYNEQLHHENINKAYKTINNGETYWTVEEKLTNNYWDPAIYTDLVKSLASLTNIERFK